MSEIIVPPCGYQIPEMPIIFRGQMKSLTKSN